MGKAIDLAHLEPHAYTEENRIIWDCATVDELFLFIRAIESKEKTPITTNINIRKIDKRINIEIFYCIIAIH